MGSISFSSDSLPRRRNIKLATVSSGGPFGAFSSNINLSLPPHVRRSDFMKEMGDSGRALSFLLENIYRFLAFSLLRKGSMPRLLHSSRVFGLLSRNPFGPFSHKKPSTCSLHIFPPGRLSASKTVTSRS